MREFSPILTARHEILLRIFLLFNITLVTNVLVNKHTYINEKKIL